MSKNRFIKSFLISIFLHAALFAGFIDYKVEKKQSNKESKMITLDISYEKNNAKQEVVQPVKKPKIQPKPKVKSKPKVKPKPIKKKVKNPIIKKQIKPQPVKKEVKKTKEVEEVKEIEPQPNTEEIQRKQARLMAKKQQAFVKTSFAIIRDKVISNLSYPKMARRMGQSGVVRVTFIISKEGRLLKYFINESSGSSLLDEAALEAVAKIKDDLFPKPPKKTKIILPVGFALK